MQEIKNNNNSNNNAHTLFYSHLIFNDKILVSTSTSMKLISKTVSHFTSSFSTVYEVFILEDSTTTSNLICLKQNLSTIPSPATTKSSFSNFYFSVIGIIIPTPTPQPQIFCGRNVENICNYSLCFFLYVISPCILSISSLSYLRDIP